MSGRDETLAPLRRFRTKAVRIALLFTAVCAALAYLWDPVAGQGALMGGIAGVLGFWIMAVRLEKLATPSEGKVKFAVLTWTSLRFALYGAVLFRAFTLDRETMHGLLGAAGGILIIRFVLIFLGITGLDLGGAPKPGMGEERQ